MESVKKAGIKDFRFHDLRHTFASHLIMSSADLLRSEEIKQFIVNKSGKLKLPGV